MISGCTPAHDEQDDRSNDDYRFRSELNAFVSLPFSRMTENVLRKEGVLYTSTGSEIFVHGTESERFADLLGSETRRPMMRGVLNPSEPEGLMQMRKLIDTLRPQGNRYNEEAMVYIGV